MLSKKYLFPVFAAAFFCACAMPARKGHPPAAAASPAAPSGQPAPARKETTVNLSPGDEKKVQMLYYTAVGAYSNNDMDAALKYLNELSAIQSSYPPAEELREKIRSVSKPPPASEKP